MERLVVRHLSLLFFLDSHGRHLDLHSFPTRRSSDLSWTRGERQPMCCASTWPSSSRSMSGWTASRNPCDPPSASSTKERSEEHTSELQSRGHLVCRLLLEKKKTNMQMRTGYST